MKICLDAGHYGKYNQSPVLKEYYESDFNWKLHILLKEELQKYGIEVITTRENQDENLELTQRGKKASGCDLFMSLHSNATDNEKADYPVVFRAYDNKNNADELALKIAKIIQDTMQTEQPGKTATRINSTNNNEYYGVLRGARNAGVPLYYIVEHSFHTNLKSVQWLLNDENVKKLAIAEAKAIAEYFNINKKAESNTNETTVSELPNLANYKGNSIVQALNSVGVDSSYANRKILAEKLGIANYRGTAEQNLKMIELLKGNTNVVIDNTKYLSNTNYNGASIVSALNEIGVDSSYDNRKIIAQKNGITNFKGTAEQNTKLLNLLKQGKLKA